jgi:hypothetical protein
MPLASTSWRSSHRCFARGVLGLQEGVFSFDVLSCFSIADNQFLYFGLMSFIVWVSLEV